MMEPWFRGNFLLEMMFRCGCFSVFFPVHFLTIVCNSPIPRVVLWDPFQMAENSMADINGGDPNHLPGWWWFQIFFIFTPKIGEDEPILTFIFFKGVGSTTN